MPADIPITREVETRAMEGLRRDFLAVPTVNAYFHGNILVGPLLDNDEIVQPPQINLSLLPGDVYDAGMGGVTRDQIPLMMKVYFPAELKAFKIGGTNPHSVVSVLIRIITRGSIDPYTDEPNGNGYILDPDWNATPPLVSPADPLRWINTHTYGCTKQAALMVPMDKPRYMLIPVAISLETKLDPITRQRVA